MLFHILDCFDDKIDNLDITKNYIYVLQLIEERYYVGRTANILNRIKQHFTGKGAKYTKKYKPLKVIEITRELSKYDERNKTFEIMEKYGWEKVRGSYWCSLEILKPNYIDNNVCWLFNFDKKIDIKDQNKNVQSTNAKMKSPMLKMLKSKNANANYPLNTGQKWSDEEERILLDELDKNTDIEIIANSHERTVGGINARRREIAFKLFENNISIEEIINKTKLTRDEILDTIQRRKNSKNIKSKKNKSELKQDIPKNNNDMEIKSEMTKMRNEISELKKTIKELVEMMNAVYEFEEV